MLVQTRAPAMSEVEVATTIAATASSILRRRREKHLIMRLTPAAASTSEWRFMAAGNAHLVFRYVGQQPEFQGRVLKLPRDADRSDRSRSQHCFVRRVLAEFELLLPFLPLQDLRLWTDTAALRAAAQGAAAKGGASTQSLALLETDLLTPPQQIARITASGGMYLTAEFKPKAGLPALVEHSDDPDSLWSLAQRLCRGSEDLRVLSRHELYCRKRATEIRSNNFYRPPELYRAMTSGRVEDASEMLIKLALQTCSLGKKNYWQIFCDGVRWTRPSGEAAGGLSGPRPSGSAAGGPPSPGSAVSSGVSTAASTAAGGAAAEDLPLSISVSSESSLGAATRLFTKLLSREAAGLFRLLLFAHALCEGHQRIARKMLAQVASAERCQEFAARTLQNLTDRATRSNSESAMDAALEQQRATYRAGLRLLERGTEEERLQWLCDYLVGRTFSDTSVMCNLCVLPPSSECDHRSAAAASLDEPGKVASLATERFVALSRGDSLVLLPDLLALQVPVFSSQEKDAAVMSWRTAQSGASLWVRISLVDLDFKAWEKIPQWEQHILSAVES